MQSRGGIATQKMPDVPIQNSFDSLRANITLLLEQYVTKLKAIEKLCSARWNYWL
jgi:hypothetical protein